MACIIPFPARRPAGKKIQYDFLTSLAKEWLAADRDKQLHEASVQASSQDEILKLLRRIDRRLAKISAA